MYSVFKRVFLLFSASNSYNIYFVPVSLYLALHMGLASPLGHCMLRWIHLETVIGSFKAIENSPASS